MPVHKATSVPPRKILLATDLSSRADRALDRAAQLAVQWQAELVIVHAMETPAATSVDVLDLPSWRRPPDPAAAIERQIRTDLREEVPRLAIRIGKGDPVGVILDTIEHEAPDLLVLGASRNELFGQILLGNTVEQLVRRSPISVLVVKRRPGGPYRHLLVGTDFTPESQRGLQVAAGLFPDAAFMVMHAFEVPYRTLLSDSQLSHDFAAMEKASMEAFLDEAELPPEIRGRVQSTIERGPPEVMLRSYVVDRHADLTVIGALGRSVMFHLFIGGNARRIVGAVPSDVLVVRHRREEEAAA